MYKKIIWLMGELRYKVFHLWLGVALGSGLVILGQGCAASGQCPACGACSTRLPILALPLLADGAIVLAGRAHRSMLAKREAQVGVPEAESRGSPNRDK